MKIIFTILFFVSTVFAQNSYDILLEKIKLYPDTTKIKMLTDYCWQNRGTNTRLALKSGTQALEIAEQIKSILLQAKSLNLLGVIQRNLGNHDLALRNYKKALNLAELIKDSTQIAFANNNIGGLYRLEGNNTLALEYILKALKLFEALKDKSGMSFCTINIGLIYKNQGNIDKALEYLNYTVDIRTEINDRSGRALAYNIIADCYSTINNFEKALEYFQKSEKEYTDLKDNKGLTDAWKGLSEIYYHMNNFKQALYYAQQSLTMSEKINYIEGIIVSQNSISLIYAKINEFEKSNYYLSAALKRAEKLNTAYLLVKSYKTGIEVGEIKKDYKSALEFNKKYDALRDSLLTEESIALVGSMESVYKYEKTDKENALLSAQLERGKSIFNLFIAIIVSGMLLSLVLYWQKRQTKKANLKLQELNAMKDKFFSIIAHDLKNPLHSLAGMNEILLSDFYELSDEEKLHIIGSIDKAGKQISKLLENLLYWSRSQIGTIEFNPVDIEINSLVNETMDLLNELARNKEINLINKTKPEDKILADSEMIKTVLRNLLTNGIKFTNKKGMVTVDSFKENGFYHISVSDTGVGMEKEIVEKILLLDNRYQSRGTDGEIGTGLGLILCKEFVEKHGGNLTVESVVGKGTKFTFTIPAKN